jgi:SAM-dependent methyltransferase
MSDLDVDALIADLRREAAALRASLGPSALPPEDDRNSALRAVATASEPASLGGFGRLMESSRLASLGALADPGDVDFHSHRVQLGRAVIGVKRVLRRLLTPILDRQAAFNRATVQAFAALEEELGQRLQSIERRLIAVEEAASAPDAGQGAAVAGVSFDYGAFEDRFRGDRAHVRAQLARYMTYFPTPAAGPVVDLGCGRGEFLELLGEAGVPAWGVEADARRAAACRARGLDVRTADALAALEEVADAALGGVASFQVVEHLTLAKTVRLLALARRKLRPGGCLIVETVNVQSLIALSRAWTIDPTHRQPLHPLTLSFLVEQAGFARSEIVYGSAVEPDTALERLAGDDAAARNTARIDALLFAPQDYAVVAWA